jgi:nucleotide-binding universal stress UspA family protein
MVSRQTGTASAFSSSDTRERSAGYKGWKGDFMPYKSGSYPSRESGAVAVAREPATILVASDGTEDSDNALEFARAFSRDDDAAVHVVSICETAPDPVAWPGLAALPVVSNPRVAEKSRSNAVRAQIERLVGDQGYWPVTVDSGSVSTSLSRAADRLGADLIVAGRGRHTLGERILGEEHLLKLIRESTVPVLAADESLRGAPRRIAVGVDFSDSQLGIAQGVARWAADDATVYLVHARPPSPLDSIDAIEWYAYYDERARAKLASLAAELDYPAGATVETRLVDGHAGMSLTHFCATEDCDVVVVGAQGTGFVHRLVVGSVTTYLLRHARCSLLTIPIAK